MAAAVSGVHYLNIGYYRKIFMANHYKRPIDRNGSRCPGKRALIGHTLILTDYFAIWQIFDKNQQVKLLLTAGSVRLQLNAANKKRSGCDGVEWIYRPAAGRGSTV